MLGAKFVEEDGVFFFAHELQFYDIFGYAHMHLPTPANSH